ncbi:MAG: pinensin family lanthipeptide [Anaerolineales bacterium]|nr:pinensin family lanthipeptide [Anaerolineales bacterium]
MKNKETKNKDMGPLKLEALEVQSFITELDEKKLESLKGGKVKCGPIPGSDSCIGSVTVH